jgi:hypothetical protein
MSPDVIRTPGAAALVRMTAFSTGLVVECLHKEEAVSNVAHTARLVRFRTPIFIFPACKTCHCPGDVNIRTEASERELNT